MNEQEFVIVFERLNTLMNPISIADAYVVLELASMCMDYLREPGSTVTDQLWLSLNQQIRTSMLMCSLSRVPDFIMHQFEMSGLAMRFVDPGVN